LKRLSIIIISLFFVTGLNAQQLSNLKSKKIGIKKDTIYLDSMSIVPSSVKLIYKNKEINPGSYNISYPDASLVFNENIVDSLLNDSLTVFYRSFPVNLSSVYKHKSSNLVNNSINREGINRYKPTDYATNFFSTSNLNKSGSISRGITTGNNQDASINSEFNLQLSGNISPDISVRANITDNNIPIQTDGTSQHLREFDNVFIELKSKKSKLVVGDFLMKSPHGYYLKYNKKIKGLGFVTNYNTEKKIKVKSSINAAVSKGKFVRQNITPVEGNQGPYKLSGKNNELYIIVLSGSERIFINGEQLQRGNDKDYTINYNTGEVSFTAKRTINKDSRIIAEFEYSELSYAGFVVSSENIFKTDNSEFYLNLFSDHEAKNQSIRQELSEEEKRLLSLVGDQTNNAFTENAVLLETFNNNEILYKRTDTLVNGIQYSGVFIQTSNPEDAVYRVGFAYTGENTGNYIKEKNSLNGIVYQWVMPENGIPQGNYEPIRTLNSPKKKQLINIGGRTKLKKGGSFYYETALSNNDLNLFSELDDNNNYGYALRLGIEKNLLKVDTSKTFFIVSSKLDFINKNFDASEPFKPTEFSRDWNLADVFETYNEAYINLSADYYNKKLIKAHAETSLLKRGDIYLGNKSNLYIEIEKKKFLSKLNLDYLRTEDSIYQTEFLRYNFITERRISNLILGINDFGEKNIFQKKMNDSISNSSFRFNQWGVYVKTSEDNKRPFKISYQNREDFLPDNEQLRYISNSQDLTVSGKIINRNKHKLSTDISYRKLQVSDTSLAGNKSEETFAGRIEHSLNLFKGSVMTSTFIEHVTGNELVRDFTYIEVQAGKGVFTWKDFNNNNIKELNEFVRANFSDEANYIRISLPTNEYTKVFNQKFNQSINITPGRIWYKEKGLKKFISLFSDRFSYRINRKFDHSTDFYSIKLMDSLIVSMSSSLKNDLGFHIKKSKTKLNYLVFSNVSKDLLTNGTDSRKINYNAFKINQFIGSFIISNSLETGKKTFESEFFSMNNFEINYTFNDSKFSYLMNQKNEASLSFSYKEKINSLGEETLYSYGGGGEYKINTDNTGNFIVKGEYINIRYSGNLNTSVSYEMTESLEPGKNFIWSALWYKKLSEFLQVELNYSGRKAGENKIIHTGGINVRAIF